MSHPKPIAVGFLPDARRAPVRPSIAGWRRSTRGAGWVRGPAARDARRALRPHPPRRAGFSRESRTPPGFSDL